MKLSEKAWKRSEKLITSIKDHPFNQELAAGTLDKCKFAYYIEQDSLYLLDFARCHAIISSKITQKYTRIFLKYALDVYATEQEVVHQFFKSTFGFKETGKLSHATLSYTSYLLRICTYEPVEIAVAAVLPCFWIYLDVGLDIAKKSMPNNVYERWIQTYSGKDFKQSVEEVIGIFNELGHASNHDIQDKMLDVFYKSTCLEWHFWNDAYKTSVFDDIECNGKKELCP